MQAISNRGTGLKTTSPSRAQTADEKRVLAAQLAEHDVDTLDFLKAASQVFGLLPSVEYRKKGAIQGRRVFAEYRPEHLRQYGRRAVYWMRSDV